MAIEIRGMAPLLQVYDIGVSLRFYCDILGFSLVSPKEWSGEYLDWALLQWNGVELMLNTIYEREFRPPQPDPARSANHDDTCLFFSCPDVDGAYQHLLSKGMQLKPPKDTPYGMRQLYLHDPDGYNLCFQWPTATA
ncbi:MAG: VOC family protein [Anaerolineae bacterium]|nr:VOC family protein [Anaerolineae bacterium]